MPFIKHYPASTLLVLSMLAFGGALQWALS